MTQGETIAAISTAPGRAGVAVVRVSGEGAFAVAQALTGREAAPGRIKFAKVRGDGCVVLAFAAPHSYTGENVVEFQCHGGAVAPRRVLEACFSAGARLARRGEFTERAFINGKIGYEAAESVIDLIDAKTDRAAEAALAGLGETHKRNIRKLYDDSMEISAIIEHSLDVDESDLPDGWQASLDERIATLANAIELERRSLKEGKILRDGALVVIAGPPNTGKSSLLNAILGENRAIVSPTAGTTRDSIEEWADIGGWPVRLVDTAGLRESSDAIEAEGVRRAESLVAKADVVVLMQNEECRIGTDGRDGATLKTPESSLIRVHSKCDLGRGDGLNVSSVTGEGLDVLKIAIAEKLEEKAGKAAVYEDESVGDGRISTLTRAGQEIAGAVEAPDLVVVANAVRRTASLLGSLVGAEYSADLLDRLFSRFCVGK